MNDDDYLQADRDAWERYCAAVELADGTRAAWVDAGSPLTVAWPAYEEFWDRHSDLRAQATSPTA